MPYSILTRTGLILGTPSFMPPEQAAGKVRDIGPASDVYSIGATLYCLLTGQPAFQGSSPLETLNMVLNEPPKEPRRYVPSIPRDLQTICLKCLEKRPLDRYPSAVAVSRDLNHFLSGEPITARPPSPIVKLRYWFKKHPKLLSRSFAAAVALLVIFVGNLWFH
ncbi:MAG: serine/threonine protein kinase, partial [Planctomycetota bacterium]